MTLADKYNFVKRGQVVEVKAEALKDKHLRKGGDGTSEVDGFEGTWRRAQVVNHTKKEKTDTRRWVIIQMIDAQAMYKDWKPLGRGKEPPLPLSDEEQAAASEDDSDDDYTPSQFAVAPVDIRPWIPFSNTNHWPRVDLRQLRIGHAVVYVDGLDACARWCGWVRRVFEDGAWLWVKGPAPGQPVWAVENHHVSCCQRASWCWKATFGRGRAVFPIEDHLRREQAYDLETGQWSLVEERAYFDPVWEFGGRISGHCPAGRRATRVRDEEVEQQCMHAAMAFIGAAIADGALPPQLQAFVQSFDTVACAADGAEDGEVEALAKMAEEPHFHDTFCGFLLDSLRQDSPVSQAGIAVFEQIKTEFQREAAALQEHMAHEFIKAHFL
eukprot:jgi/Ulvmu1/7971/UM004_0204.1